MPTLFTWLLSLSRACAGLLRKHHLARCELWAAGTRGELPQLIFGALAARPFTYPFRAARCLELPRAAWASPVKPAFGTLVETRKPTNKTIKRSPDTSALERQCTPRAGGECWSGAAAVMHVSVSGAREGEGKPAPNWQVSDNLGQEAQPFGVPQLVAPPWGTACE